MNFSFDREYVRVMDKRLKICEILRENNLSASETVFIGDMQHDVETAKTGGIDYLNMCCIQASRLRRCTIRIAVSPSET